MSDTDNWVCVHATKYDPKCNSAGERYIETTATATNYRCPRATIHSTLNWVVANHGGGNWDDASIVVLIPYKDLVSKNVDPQQVSTFDTFFIPDPDKGLVLPDGTYIIRPDPNCNELFQIGENSAIYKTDHYTEDEIKDILSLNDRDKEEYEEYIKGDLPEYMIKRMLGNNERLLKAYEKTKNKKELRISTNSIQK